MQRLAEDGLVRREPGRGSFVAKPPAHRRANRLMTFTQEMRRAGRVPSSRVLTRAIRPSSPAEAASLGIPARQPVVHLRRLRLADDQPIALESAVLIGACADAVMTADLAHGSLHETLGRAGFVLSRGTGTIAAAAATAEEARLLGIHAGDPAAGRAARHRRRARPRDRGDRVRATRPTDTRSTSSSRSKAGAQSSPPPRLPRIPPDAGRRGARLAPRRRGRLVLDDRVAAGRVTIEDGWIAAVDLDDGVGGDEAVPRARVRRRPRPRLGRPRRDGRLAALDGMARALLRRGVTSFLPTAVTAPSTS